jgi:hypothetical protein
MKRSGSTEPRPGSDDASALIDARIEELGGWRGDALATLRKLIRAADPGIVEEWKWDVPVWSHAGILCTGEAYKTAIKLTFAKGAALPDPKRLFNASLEGATRRAIDVREGDAIDGEALKTLIRAAVALNAAGKAKLPARAAKKTSAKTMDRIATKTGAKAAAGPAKPSAARRIAAKNR